MKGKLLCVLGILTLLLALFPASVSADKPLPNYSPMDAGPQIRAEEPSLDLIAPPDAGVLAAEQAVGAQAMAGSCAGTPVQKIWLIRTLTGYGLAYFTLYTEGPLAQIWVQNNLSWPAGDSRVTPVVTCEQAQYLLGEFENNIYPKELSFFGEPDFLDGSNSILSYPPGGVGPGYYYDEAGRQVILVSNIRDDNYINPSYPSYIAGFFSPSFELYFDRNVMSIDAYDWANRTGPTAARPYLYEGVFAHEYQHLLHSDYDSDEELWINEGMADLAEEIVGYFPALIGHIDWAGRNPENSLTVWEDQGGLEILTDYGQAYLFQHYLAEKFGRPFIQALFHNQDNSITSVNSTLDAGGINTTFVDIFHNWSVAMLIDSLTPGGGRYQFEVEFPFPFKLNVGTPAQPNPQAYDTPGAPPWGTDYIWIPGNPKNLAKLTFDGLEVTRFPSAWTSVDGMLWGGQGDLMDNWAIFETTGGGTLTFDTMYDIEEFWDFGFVQVSTDGGLTWTSLANGFTTTEYDPSAHAKIKANVPGLTGTLAAVTTMSFDLGAYAGQNILVAFRYVTDWGTTGAGWFVDNVTVDGTLISDGTNPDAFHDLTYYLPIKNDFTVTFVGVKSNGKGNVYKVLTMKLSELEQSGLYELDAVLKDSASAMMMVSLDVPEDQTGYVDYTYDFTFTNSGPKK